MEATTTAQNGLSRYLVTATRPEELSFFNRILAWGALHILPKYSKFGLSRLALWYDTNGYYRFKPGQQIHLRDYNLSRYRNIGTWVIKGYSEEGLYVIDADGEEKEFGKWRLEHHFRPAPNSN